jgi:hypothetical protein
VEAQRVGPADWSARLAGALIAIVGVLNLVVAVLSLTTGLVRLSPAATGGFVAVGLLVTAAGALVWRGNRAATILAFAIFAALLMIQIPSLFADPDPVTAQADQPLARAVVLALLSVTTGLAALRSRRRAPATNG